MQKFAISLRSLAHSARRHRFSAFDINRLYQTMVRGPVIRVARELLRSRPTLKRVLREGDTWITRQRHSLAVDFPILIQAEPKQLTVAITANCNLRCVGCRYGRDFMFGQQLPLPLVVDLLHDAKDAGFQNVRLYGGEPLLHRDLPRMVHIASDLGLKPAITTNGLLLGAKIHELYDAGLRTLTIGFYGTGGAYDRYVQRSSSYDKLERSVAGVRDRYGLDVQMQINFLLAKPSCNLIFLKEALDFAKRYRTRVQIDIVHYSLPYFSEGVDRELQFTAADREPLEEIVRELLKFKENHPELYPEPVASIRSIPDWAVKGPDMRVPCTAYRMIWVGADGTVQLCYVTFKLGNLHETRLRDMLFSKEHKEACRHAFGLKCPNCHCERDSRIQTHAASQRLYSRSSAPSPIHPLGSSR
jgi:MoaA/NifB/PqqE/SkfB family radical SAM enzyme